jgi:FkbM family methyltransferase
MIKICKTLNDIPIGTSLAVYGAGGRAKSIVSLILKQRTDIKIIFIFDDFLIGKDLFGYKVEKYHESLIGWEYILIASIHIYEIIEKLHNNQNILILDESSTNVNDSQKISLKYVAANLNNAANIIFNLKNPFIYLFLILRRIGLKVNISKYVVNGFFKNQYLDFIFMDKIKVVLDLGVHDGYTSNQFLRKFNNVIAIYGFDISIKALEASSNKDELKNSGKFYFKKNAIFNYVGDINININSDNLSASTVDALNNSNSVLSVRCTTIDQIRKDINHKIDFIKFDIEGAELGAIEGGLKTFITDRPQLAVSIYHSNSDFIEIPSLLIKTLKNYNYYLGHYSTGIYETVLYCIPKELYEIN